jgi:hypothetical protein
MDSGEKRVVKEIITEVGSRWLMHMRGRLFCTPCEKHEKHHN